MWLWSTYLTAFHAGNGWVAGGMKSSGTLLDHSLIPDLYTSKLASGVILQVYQLMVTYIYIYIYIYMYIYIYTYCSPTHDCSMFSSIFFSLTVTNHGDTHKVSHWLNARSRSTAEWMARKHAMLRRAGLRGSKARGLHVSWRNDMVNDG